MLAQLNAQILNHLLSQNTWATERLRPFAGKTITLSLTPLQARLRLLANGEFDSASPDAPTDATLSLPPGAALRFLLDRKLDAAQLRLEGDTELATEIGKILQQLRWDYEEDLSRVIGDMPAHELAGFGQRSVAEAKRQATSLAGMFAEFWLEEDPLIAKRTHLEKFAQDVDTLREDAERLAKRLQRLEKQSS